MTVNYEKLYVYLVGQVDDALQFIAGELVKSYCHDQSTLLTVSNQLKNALLTAEDMYLDGADKE